MAKENQDTVFYPGQAGSEQPVAPNPGMPMEAVPMYDQNLGETVVSPNMNESTIPDRVAPYPETSGWKKALAAFGYAIPGPLNAPFIAPYFLSEQRISGLRENDQSRMDMFEKILKDDPDNAGELLKNPIFAEPIMRLTQATGKDISNLSYTLTHKKMSTDEKIRLIGAGGMLDEKENIIPRPYSSVEAAQKEYDLKKQDFDDFSSAYGKMPFNKDKSPEEVKVESYMAYNSLGKRSANGGHRYTLGTSAQNFVIVDQDDPNPKTAFHKIPTGAMKKLKYAWVQDDQGTVGFAILPESIDPGMNLSDVPYAFKDAAEFLSENGVSPDVIRSVYGDRRALMQKVGDIIRGLDPDFKGFLPETIPGEQVQEGNVTAPPSITPGAKPKTKYLGPAKDQRSEAERIADMAVNGD